MRGRVQAISCVLAAISVAGFATTASAGDSNPKANGKQLSSQCTECHRIDGTENGVPSIIGWPDEDFIFVLKAYRDGGRTNADMVSAAQGLNEGQMRALARFFGSLNPRVRLR